MHIMVKSPNEGIVKTDGVDFTVMEEIICTIMGISMIGKTFYRDRHISRQVVIEFTKDKEGFSEERYLLPVELTISSTR